MLQIFSRHLQKKKKEFFYGSFWSHKKFNKTFPFPTYKKPVSIKKSKIESRKKKHLKWTMNKVSAIKNRISWKFGLALNGKAIKARKHINRNPVINKFLQDDTLPTTINYYP